MSPQFKELIVMSIECLEMTSKRFHAIGHRRRLLVTGDPVIRHMQRAELPWENGNSHEARDLFAARASHFENAAIDSCFEKPIPAMNPAIVAGFGPFFGPFWSDSHQIEGGRVHVECRSEVA